jgi:spermidine/putrescine transport system permease protein
MTSAVATRKRPWGLYLYAALFLLFLYGPVLLLPIFSLNDSTIIAFPFKGLTFRWYQELANDDQLIMALFASLRVAVSVAVIATALGVASGWALSRYRIPGSRPIFGFMMLPLVVPGLILGVSLLIVAGALGVKPSLMTVAVGHMILCLPFSLAVMMSRFEGFDRNLEEASRDLGEGPVFTFFRIILPIALPGVLSSLLMTFTISFDEFVLSFFLSGSQATLPVYMWAQLRFPQKLPSVLALASLILLSSFLLVTLAERLRNMGKHERKPA